MVVRYFENLSPLPIAALFALIAACNGTTASGTGGQGGETAGSGGSGGSGGSVLALACPSTAKPIPFADVAPLFTGCAGGEVCHGGLFLSASNLVGAPSERDQCTPQRVLVTPGDPDQSYLVHKLRGVDMCSGERMPFGDPLSVGDIQKIVDWICGGASD